MLLLPLMVLWATLPTICETRIHNVASRKYTQGPSSPQRLYTDHLLWDVNVRTLRECSVLCSTDDRCLAFSLSKNDTAGGGSSSVRFCRAFSTEASDLASGSAFVVVADTVLFEVASRSSLAEPGDGTTVATTTTTTTTAAAPITTTSATTTPATTTTTTTTTTTPTTTTPTTTMSTTTATTTPPTTTTTTPPTTTPTTTTPTTTTPTTTTPTTTTPTTTTPTTTTTKPTTTTPTTTTTTATTTTPINEVWPNVSCTGDSKCTSVKINTSCYNGTCACTAGWFYSVSTGNCVQNCPSGNLQTTFTRYLNKVILSNDDETATASTPAACLSLCSSSTNFVCVSVDYIPSISQQCRMSSKTATDVSSGYFTNNPIGDHYQRQCS